MPEFSNALGHTFKDKITGFTGVATGHVFYTTGCNQILLAPKCGDDGSFKESQWFDVQRLELLDQERIRLDNSRNPGACEAAPKR